MRATQTAQRLNAERDNIPDLRGTLHFYHPGQPYHDTAYNGSSRPGIRSPNLESLPDSQKREVCWASSRGPPPPSPSLGRDLPDMRRVSYPTDAEPRAFPVKKVRFQKDYVASRPGKKNETALPALENHSSFPKFSTQTTRSIAPARTTVPHACATTATSAACHTPEPKAYSTRSQFGEGPTRIQPAVGSLTLPAGPRRTIWNCQNNGVRGQAKPACFSSQSGWLPNPSSVPALYSNDALQLPRLDGRVQRDVSFKVHQEACGPDASLTGGWRAVSPVPQVHHKQPVGVLYPQNYHTGVPIRTINLLNAAQTQQNGRCTAKYIEKLQPIQEPLRSDACGRRSNPHQAYGRLDCDSNVGGTLRPLPEHARDPLKRFGTLTNETSLLAPPSLERGLNSVHLGVRTKLSGNINELRLSQASHGGAQDSWKMLGKPAQRVKATPEPSYLYEVPKLKIPGNVGNFASTLRQCDLKGKPLQPQQSELFNGNKPWTGGYSARPSLPKPPPNTHLDNSSRDATSPTPALYRSTLCQRPEFASQKECSQKDIRAVRFSVPSSSNPSLPNAALKSFHAMPYASHVPLMPPASHNQLNETPSQSNFYPEPSAPAGQFLDKTIQIPYRRPLASQTAVDGNGAYRRGQPEVLLSGIHLPAPEPSLARRQSFVPVRRSTRPHGNTANDNSLTESCMALLSPKHRMTPLSPYLPKIQNSQRQSFMRQLACKAREWAGSTGSKVLTRWVGNEEKAEEKAAGMGKSTNVPALMPFAPYGWPLNQADVRRSTSLDAAIQPPFPALWPIQSRSQQPYQRSTCASPVILQNGFYTKPSMGCKTAVNQAPFVVFQKRYPPTTREVDTGSKQLKASTMAQSWEGFPISRSADMSIAPLRSRSEEKQNSQLASCILASSLVASRAPTLQPSLSLYSADHPPREPAIPERVPLLARSTPGCRQTLAAVPRAERWTNNKSQSSLPVAPVQGVTSSSFSREMINVGSKVLSIPTPLSSYGLAVDAMTSHNNSEDINKFESPKTTASVLSVSTISSDDRDGINDSPILRRSDDEELQTVFLDSRSFTEEQMKHILHSITRVRLPRLPNVQNAIQRKTSITTFRPFSSTVQEYPSAFLPVFASGWDNKDNALSVESNSPIISRMVPSPTLPVPIPSTRSHSLANMRRVLTQSVNGTAAACRRRCLLSPLRLDTRFSGVGQYRSSSESCNDVIQDVETVIRHSLLFPVKTFDNLKIPSEPKLPTLRFPKLPHGGTDSPSQQVSTPKSDLSNRNDLPEDYVDIHSLPLSSPTAPPPPTCRQQLKLLITDVQSMIERADHFKVDELESLLHSLGNVVYGLADRCQRIAEAQSKHATENLSQKPSIVSSEFSKVAHSTRSVQDDLMAVSDSDNSARERNENLSDDSAEYTQETVEGLSCESPEYSPERDEDLPKAESSVITTGLQSFRQDQERAPSFDSTEAPMTPPDLSLSSPLTWSHAGYIPPPSEGDREDSWMRATQPCALPLKIDSPLTSSKSSSTSVSQTPRETYTSGDNAIPETLNSEELQLVTESGQLLETLAFTASREHSGGDQQRHKLAIIEEGAFGTVCLGIYRGVDVAVKIPSQEALEGNPEGTLDRFVHEWNIMRRCQHRGIVTLIGGLAISDQEFWLVMERVRGPDLHTLRFVQQEPIPIIRGIKMCWELSEILRYLHTPEDDGFLPSEFPSTTKKQIVVHRDIKPENVLVSEDWEVRICDFGDSEESSNGHISRVRGATWLYAPPELLMSCVKGYASTSVGSPLSSRGQSHDSQAAFAFSPVHDIMADSPLAGKQRVKPLTVKWDIWSAGCVFQEMLGGWNPFRHLVGEDAAPDDIFLALNEALGNGTFVPQIEERLPKACQNVIQACLAFDPEDRPTALELEGYWARLYADFQNVVPALFDASLMVTEMHVLFKTAFITERYVVDCGYVEQYEPSRDKAILNVMVLEQYSGSSC